MDNSCFCNKNTFLNYLLVLALINLLVLYVYQNLNYYCDYFDINVGVCKKKSSANDSNNSNDSNDSNDLNDSNDSNNIKITNLRDANQKDMVNKLKEMEINNKSNKLNLNYIRKENKHRLKNNNFGAKGEFHEKFKKSLPELGWRRFFNKNYGGINNVCELSEDCNQNFKGVITKNYLKNMKNTDNIYKNVSY